MLFAAWLAKKGAALRVWQESSPPAKQRVGSCYEGNRPFKILKLMRAQDSSIKRGTDTLIDCCRLLSPEKGAPWDFRDDCRSDSA